MTPVKASGAPINFFINDRGGGTGTGTVSGMMGASIDGEDFDYRLNSERDDDNITLKNSEHRATQSSFISGPGGAGEYNHSLN